MSAYFVNIPVVASVCKEEQSLWIKVLYFYLPSFCGSSVTAVAAVPLIVVVVVASEPVGIKTMLAMSYNLVL